MLRKIFTNLIGSKIVATGRAIKVNNLKIFDNNGFQITPEQYFVLSILNEEGSLYQKKLGERLYKDKANITRILSILEEKGLIEKSFGIENEKQVNKVMITEKGKSISAEIYPIVEALHNKYVKNISDDELYTCIKVLEKIQENIAGEL